MHVIHKKLFTLYYWSKFKDVDECSYIKRRFYIIYELSLSIDIR